jgi:hypothetical protein
MPNPASIRKHPLGQTTLKPQPASESCSFFNLRIKNASHILKRHTISRKATGRRGNHAFLIKFRIGAPNPPVTPLRRPAGHDTSYSLIHVFHRRCPQSSHSLTIVKQIQRQPANALVWQAKAQIRHHPIKTAIRRIGIRTIFQRLFFSNTPKRGQQRVSIRSAILSSRSLVTMIPKVSNRMNRLPFFFLFRLIFCTCFTCCSISSE